MLPSVQPAFTSATCLSGIDTPGIMVEIYSLPTSPNDGVSPRSSVLSFTVSG